MQTQIHYVEFRNEIYVHKGDVTAYLRETAAAEGAPVAARLKELANVIDRLPLRLERQ